MPDWPLTRLLLPRVVPQPWYLVNGGTVTPTTSTTWPATVATSTTTYPNNANWGITINVPTNYQYTIAYTMFQTERSFDFCECSASGGMGVVPAVSLLPSHRILM